MLSGHKNHKSCYGSFWFERREEKGDIGEVIELASHFLKCEVGQAPIAGVLSLEGKEWTGNNLNSTLALCLACYRKTQFPSTCTIRV